MLKRLLQKARGSSLQKDERGAGQVEFSLTILLALIIVCMTVELCSLVYTYVVLSEAANEGVRYWIVHSSDEAGAIAKVHSYAANSLHNMSGMIVTPGPVSSTVPDKVGITISYPYVPYLNFMSSPPTMHAYAEGRLVF